MCGEPQLGWLAVAYQWRRSETREQINDEYRGGLPEHWCPSVSVVAGGTSKGIFRRRMTRCLRRREAIQLGWRGAVGERLVMERLVLPVRSVGRVTSAQLPC